MPNDDLVGVDEDDLVHGQREEDVQEEDLVSPDDALLLRLLVEPARPLVLDQLVLEAVRLGHVRDGLLPRTQARAAMQCKIKPLNTLNTLNFPS